MAPKTELRAHTIHVAACRPRRTGPSTTKTSISPTSKDRKDLPAMGGKEPASVIRVRALNKLKTALKRTDLTSTVESSGTSRIVLHVLSLGIEAIQRKHTTTAEATA
jgi:hypothetical protein